MFPHSSGSVVGGNVRKVQGIKGSMRSCRDFRTWIWTTRYTMRGLKAVRISRRIRRVRYFELHGDVWVRLKALFFFLFLFSNSRSTPMKYLYGDTTLITQINKIYYFSLNKYNFIVCLHIITVQPYKNSTLFLFCYLNIIL